MVVPSPGLRKRVNKSDLEDPDLAIEIRNEESLEWPVSSSLIVVYNPLREWNLFSIVAVPVYIPTNSVVGYLLLHTLFRVNYLDFLMTVILTREVITLCTFDLHFSNN